jgi:hypothetical protein
LARLMKKHQGLIAANILLSASIALGGCATLAREQTEWDKLQDIFAQVNNRITYTYYLGRDFRYVPKGTTAPPATALCC